MVKCLRYIPPPPPLSSPLILFTIVEEFIDKSNNYSIYFPHDLFDNFKNINYKNINTVFLIFESIYSKNHLNNINYKMPIQFKNFKHIILNQLMK